MNNVICKNAYALGGIGAYLCIYQNETNLMYKNALASLNANMIS